MVLQVKEARDYDVRQLRDMKMSVNIQATIRKIAIKTLVKTRKARFPLAFSDGGGGIEMIFIPVFRVRTDLPGWENRRRSHLGPAELLANGHGTCDF